MACVVLIAIFHTLAKKVLCSGKALASFTLPFENNKYVDDIFFFSHVDAFKVKALLSDFSRVDHV